MDPYNPHNNHKKTFMWLSTLLPKTSVVFVIIYCALISWLWLLFPTPFLIVIIGFLPLLFINPVLACLAFMIFSYFRIHEAFFVLYPLRIPQMLGIAMLTILAFNLLTGQIKPFWNKQLTLFTAFSVFITIDIVFSTNRAESWAFWQENYSKIAISVFAFAWLIRTEKDFKLATVLIVLSGLAIGCVALYNKVNGIDLVEGTRVTIGRTIPSLIGDPNDLALVLLFPTSFALAFILTQGTPLYLRILGLITFMVIFLAILATQSRGGLLGFVAVTGIFARQQFKSKLFFVSAIAAVGVVILKMANLGGRVSGGAAEVGIDESAQGRLYAWEAAFKMAKARPLTGVGMNNFVNNYFNYTPVWGGIAKDVHSSWLKVLAETGIIGFGLFISLVILTLLNSYRTTKLLMASKETTTSPILLLTSRGIFAGLVGFCVAGTFLTQAFTWSFYTLLAFSLALQHLLEIKRGKTLIPPPMQKNLGVNEHKSPSP